MKYVPTRTDLLNLLPKGGRGIEIGVFKGDFSREILDIVQPEMLYLLDRFVGMVRSGDKDGNNIEAINYSSYYQLIQKQFDLPNVVIHKGNSSDVSIYRDRYFDWCYIDADHSYEAVKADLRAVYPKVKIGGWIMGHDYAERTPGVIQAVNEFCKANMTRIIYLTKDYLYLCGGR